MKYRHLMIRHADQDGFYANVAVRPDPDIVSAVAEVISAFPHFNTRPAQREAAVLFADFLRCPDNYPSPYLIFEGPTGSGKTHIALVAATALGLVRQDARNEFVYATGTRVLQEQLIRDTQRFVGYRATWDFDAAPFMGLHNYVCMLAADNARLSLPDEIADWLEFTDEDELVWGSFPGTKDQWAEISSTSDACLGTSCPYNRAQGSDLVCLGKHAMRRAHAASMLVANFRLLAMGAVSERRLLIADEAHLLPGQLRDQLSGGVMDIPGHFAEAAEARRAFTRLATRLSVRADRDAQGYVKPDSVDIPLCDALIETLIELYPRYTREAERADDLIESQRWTVAAKATSRLTALAELVKDPTAGDRQRFIMFNDRSGRIIVEDLKPRVDVLENFSAVVMMSATPGATGPASLAHELGVSAIEAGLDSPFSVDQSRIFVPANMPNPKLDRRLYDAAVVQYAVSLVHGVGGRGALCLATSYRMVSAIASALRAEGFVVFAQEGRSARAVADEFRAHFRETGEGVLVGTQTFMTGFDHHGLRLVMLDKLPYAPPSARARALDDAGGSSYREISRPHMITVLRQAVGRLVRSHDDRGIVAVLDPRYMTHVPHRAVHRAPVIQTTQVLTAWYEGD